MTGERFTIAYKATPIVSSYRRWFWRVRHRYGEGHYQMTDKQIERELRAMSWRRAL